VPFGRTKPPSGQAPLLPSRKRIIQGIDDRFGIHWELLEEFYVAHRLIGFVASDGTKAERRLAFDQLGTHVRGHDDNRVPEIDLLAEAIGDFALFQNCITAG
jgi:hypothetical protein